MKATLTLFLILLISCGSGYAQNANGQKSNLVDKRKSSIYVAHDFLFTLSINYERLFPVSEKISFGLRAGLGNDYGNRSLAAIGEGIILCGRSKHFFEFGIGYHQPFLYFDEGPDNPAVAIMAGYRYQSDKGFLFKIYPEFLPELFESEDSWGSLPFIGFAIGYSF